MSEQFQRNHWAIHQAAAGTCATCDLVAAERGEEVKIMTGAIPAYGQWFRREPWPYPDGYDWNDRDRLAGTRYVLKVDADWHIQSNAQRTKWWVFWRGQRLSAPFEVMRDAMTACRSAWDRLNDEALRSAWVPRDL